jgi:hypothetical protein
LLIVPAAYFSIPVQLVLFQMRMPIVLHRYSRLQLLQVSRKVLHSVHKWTIGLFASFILLCGMTHTLNMFKSNSLSWMNSLAGVKLACAVVSMVSSNFPSLHAPFCRASSPDSSRQVTMITLLKVIPAVIYEVLACFLPCSDPFQQLTSFHGFAAGHSRAAAGRET